VSRITVDPGWLTGYAITVDQAADDLTAVLAMVAGTSVTASSFGAAGRQANLPAAYADAAGTLRQRLAGMVDALHAVAASLEHRD
jgi:ABC-type nickel/cobalt efflux system permease component RcnA